MISCYESSYETEIAFRDSFKDMYDMEAYVIDDELKYLRESLRWGYDYDETKGLRWGWDYDESDMMYELLDEYIQIRINEFDKWFEY